MVDSVVFYWSVHVFLLYTIATMKTVKDKGILTSWSEPIIWVFKMKFPGPIWLIFLIYPILSNFKVS